jgi:hypothetical protein
MPILCCFQTMRFDNGTNLNMSHSCDTERIGGQISCISSLCKIENMPKIAPTREPTPVSDAAREASKLVGDTHLSFDYHLFCAQFKEPGKYYLHLSMHTTSEDQDRSDIVMEENDDGNYVRTHEAYSGSITQPKKKIDDYIYVGQKWTFYMPKGMLV